MKCLICGDFFKKNKIVKVAKGYDYLVCPICSGGVLMPRLKALNEIKNAYTSDYFKWDEVKGIRKYIYKIRLFISYSNWIARSYKKTGKLLDVGAGVPGFVIDMKKHGWECWALEISAQQVKLIEKYIGKDKVFKGDFEKYRLARNNFDVLTFWHMLEHLAFPAKAVRKSAGVLKKNGMIFAELPNFDSINLYLFKENYSYFDLPGHLFYYNKTSLVKLFENNGFKNIQISYPLKLNGSFSLNLSNLVYKKSKKYFLKMIVYYLSLPFSIILSVVSSGMGKTDLLRVSALKK